MKRHITTLIALLALLLQSCSGDDNFVIEGTVRGIASQNVTLTYFANGGLKSITMPATDGHFAFSASSPSATLALISVSPDNHRLATVIVRNGDHITITADINDPYAAEVKGNADSEAIAKWIKENTTILRNRNTAAINRAVEKYVGANKDQLHALAILSTFYTSEGYEAKADSLFSLLSPEARPVEVAQGFDMVISSRLSAMKNSPVPMLKLYERSDSIVTVNPMRHSATLLCFIDTEGGSRDSIASQLRYLAGHYDKSRFAAVEISTAPDSAAWRQSIRRDSTMWTQTWVPGGTAGTPIRRLAIPRLPYFITADSTGRAIYRGSSVAKARKAVESVLK